jgi:hypothetical protein
VFERYGIWSFECRGTFSNQSPEPDRHLCRIAKHSPDSKALCQLHWQSKRCLCDTKMSRAAPKRTSFQRWLSTTKPRHVMNPFLWRIVHGWGYCNIRSLINNKVLGGTPPLLSCCRHPDLVYLGRNPFAETLSSGTFRILQQAAHARALVLGLPA